MCCIINGVWLEKELVLFSSISHQLPIVWVKFQGPSLTVADIFANFTFCRSYLWRPRNYELSVQIQGHSWHLLSGYRPLLPLPAVVSLPLHSSSWTLDRDMPEVFHLGLSTSHSLILHIVTGFIFLLLYYSPSTEKRRHLPFTSWKLSFYSDESKPRLSSLSLSPKH